MNGLKNIGGDYILWYGVVKALPTPLPFNTTEEPKEDIDDILIDEESADFDADDIDNDLFDGQDLFDIC